MIVTVCSFKGGVGKTTTALHVAAYFQMDAPTLLVDGDPNRSATGWAKRGAMPFRVVDVLQAAKFARSFSHVVIDTKARPEPEDLEAMASGCDLLLIPTTPDVLALDALALTIGALRKMGAEQYRILLTMVPPKPSRLGDEARALIAEANLPIFEGSIRRAAAFQTAAVQGVPIYSLSGTAAQMGWEDYRAVCREIKP